MNIVQILDNSERYALRDKLHGIIPYGLRLPSAATPGSLVGITGGIGRAGRQRIAVDDDPTGLSFWSKKYKLRAGDTGISNDHAIVQP